jgi:uncharacterized C2H2 Zn-finger protein
VTRTDVERFRDRLERLCCFAGEILVRCPRCDRQASVVPDPNSAVDRGHLWLRRRLVCGSCGHTDEWAAPRIPGSTGRSVPDFDGPEDPYFGLQLWLSADCRGHVLWAYNAGHLDLLHDYVAAQVRDRGDRLGTMSLVERLPAWIKEAKHRDEVLKTIGRLRLSLA